MIHIVITINCLLAALISAGYYPIIGICMLIFSVIMIFMLSNSALSDFFIRTQIKKYGNVVEQIDSHKKKLLISDACLIISLKVSAAVAVFVETSTIIFITFCILLSFGYFFGKSESGMTIGLSYSFAWLLVRPYLFVSVTFDRIAMWVAKVELYLLGIQS